MFMEAFRPRLAAYIVEHGPDKFPVMSELYYETQVESGAILKELTGVVSAFADAAYYDLDKGCATVTLRGEVIAAGWVGIHTDCFYLGSFNCSWIYTQQTCIVRRCLWMST